MANDNKIEIQITAVTDELKSGLADVESQVNSTTNAIGGSMDKLAASTERGGIAMKGFHFAGHEMFTELGVGSRMARGLGREMEVLAGSLGPIAPILGGITLAVMVGTQIWEHF